jgi:hypothetical protein
MVLVLIISTNQIGDTDERSNNTGLVQAKPLSKILGEMSVVAAVHVSSLGTTRLDRTASAQSDRAHNAMMGAGRTT